MLEGGLTNISFSQKAEAAVSVKGYYRKNGTYVQPHMRSNPDGNPYNNWSYPGNTNPYTGKTATGNPSTYLNNYYNRSNSYTSPSYSPSYYTPPVPVIHTCPAFSSYNTLSQSCKCYNGYYVQNGSCVSVDEICKDQYGFNANSTINDKCSCSYGYRFNSSGTKCISDDDYCSELDSHAEWNILTGSCSCRDGYIANASKSACVPDLSSGNLPYLPVNIPAYTPENTYLPSSSSVPSDNCGAHMHESRTTCYCDVGYAGDWRGCTFTGCPGGYSLDAVTMSCSLRSTASNPKFAVSCITTKPCTCPTGYEPMGNRRCVPK
jgi:hypothetical protein